MKSLNTTFKCISIIFFLLFSNIVFGQFDPWEKLVLFLEFENNIKDSSSYDHSVVSDGTIIYTGGHNPNKQCIYFNGESYLDLGGGFELPDSFSIFMWIKAESIIEEWQALFTQWDSDSNSGSYWFGLNKDLVNYWISNFYNMNSNINIQPKEWIPICWTGQPYNSGLEGKIYIYGELTGVGDFSKIDKSSFSVDIGNGFVGFIDELRIYKKALSEGEIKELIDVNPANGFGLVSQEVSVFPNPTTNGFFSLYFQQPISNPLIVKVYDALGKNIEIKSLQKGTSVSEFDLSNQSSRGVYFITIQNEEQILKTLKLIKQ